MSDVHALQMPFLYLLLPLLLTVKLLRMTRGNGVKPANDSPLPRAPRQRRRAKADRGLPPDEELARLAAEYLRLQRQHWPELAKAGVLPDHTPEIIAAMVEDFKARHRTGRVNAGSLPQLDKSGKKFGGVYCRYSRDNSSTNSIPDQMRNAFAKAHQEGRFVPWTYVFADYSARD